MHSSDASEAGQRPGSRAARGEGRSNARDARDGGGARPRGPRAGALPKLRARPRCTVVIPCLNEARYIEAALRSAMAQTYPPELVDIVVVDGRSTDRTRAIVASLSLDEPRISVLDNPKRLQSAAMNLAIRASSADVIVRMDAHADYAPDYVEQSVRVLRETGAMNVGGAARAVFANDRQRAVAVALTHPFGVGGSAYRDGDREGWVESVWNGAFRREAFEIVGLYDEEARTNEDAELNQRILEAGGGVYLSRDIVVHYYPRDSIPALARQYFRYGEGRARTLYKRGGFISLRPLVPFAFVTALTSLALLASTGPIFEAGLWAFVASYSVAIAYGALSLGLRHGLSLAPRLAATFVTMHVAHGAGFWAGLVRHASLIHRGWRPQRVRRSRPRTPSDARTAAIK